MYENNTTLNTPGTSIAQDRTQGGKQEVGAKQGNAVVSMLVNELPYE